MRGIWFCGEVGTPSRADPVVRLCGWDGDWVAERSLSVFREFCRLLDSGSTSKAHTKYSDSEVHGLQRMVRDFCRVSSIVLLPACRGYPR